MRIAKALLAACIIASPLFAQLRGGLPVLAPSSPRPSISPGFAGHSGHHGFSRSIYLGSPFWGDGGYSQEPPVYVIQPPTTERPRAVVDERKPEAPLLIELQGDRYVRRSGESNPNAVQTNSVASAAPRSGVSRNTASATHNVELAPAWFVFRDGHREESSDYSIIAGVIYSRGNYWTTGSWSKKIPISDLDVAATLRANQDRGVPFRLPSAPNEVITRP